jgi:hypothetical protein
MVAEAWLRGLTLSILGFLQTRQTWGRPEEIGMIFGGSHQYLYQQVAAL